MSLLLSCVYILEILNYIPVKIYLGSSKLTIETPEECVKSVQNNKKDTRKTSVTLFWCIDC